MKNLHLPPLCGDELEARALAEANKGIADHTTASVVSLADDRTERVQWLWEPRIAFGSVSLLVGPPDSGKSTIAFDLCARLSAATGMPGTTLISSQRALGSRRRRQPIASLMLVGEDNVSTTVRPRLLAAGANLDYVHRLPTVKIGDDPDRPPQFPTDIATIERTMCERSARLLVVDVLGCFLADGMSLNDDAAMRKLFSPLAAMAERTHAAVLILLHLNKKSGLGVLDRIAESTAIAAAARSILLAARDPTDPDQYILAAAKSNLDPRRESMEYRIDERRIDCVRASRIVWRGTSHVTASELLDRGSNCTKVQQAEDIIRRMIADGRTGATEIRDACREAGISERTFNDARCRLGVASVRVGFGADGQHVLSLDRQRQRRATR